MHVKKYSCFYVDANVDVIVDAVVDEKNINPHKARLKWHFLAFIVLIESISARLDDC